ncbi:hypothetical protein RXV95_07930 [Novosphingobium sp. ZN18A2]|uniref:tetratricopeptide repeat-containing protein n=1 Tax=Novosphingobium sp. ZN18A2 TaxID=3079861 RepID=UPI0030D3E0E7
MASIITIARAGGLQHAEAQFQAGGFDARTNDPAALAVKGRLLKDRAVSLPPARRRPLFEQAARYYAAADELRPQPYTRINTATLAMLSGDEDLGCTIARELIDWMDRDTGIAETPYYLSATRAEALILCDDVDGAKEAMRHALAHDPDGWDEHAVTIRQLSLVLSSKGKPADWLDALRPPRSLHYAGHLGVAADSPDLEARIDRFIDSERIGFGFGALAAGSDILVAERLLAAGAELHVVLPNRIEDFINASVAPYAQEWRNRFDSCLNAAASVRTMTRFSDGFQPLATRLASDTAKGSALRHAARLESEAVQLVIVDEGPGEYGSGLETRRSGEIWRRTGARQHIMRWPRNASVPASGQRQTPEGRADLRLTALLHIAFDGLEEVGDESFARAVDDVLTPLRRAIDGIAVQPDLVLPIGNARICAFAEPVAAWQHASDLMKLQNDAFPMRLTAHYGLAHWLDDPMALVGRTLTELVRISEGAIPGVLTTSETFADALQLMPGTPPQVEPVGEVSGSSIFAAHLR